MAHRTPDLPGLPFGDSGDRHYVRFSGFKERYRFRGGGQVHEYGCTLLCYGCLYFFIIRLSGRPWVGLLTGCCIFLYPRLRNRRCSTALFFRTEGPATGREVWVCNSGRGAGIQVRQPGSFRYTGTVERRCVSTLHCDPDERGRFYF